MTEKINEQTEHGTNIAAEADSQPVEENQLLPQGFPKPIAIETTSRAE